MCDDPEASDKDEAEGDDSEMESEEEVEEPVVNKEEPIKQLVICHCNSISERLKFQTVHFDI